MDYNIILEEVIFKNNHEQHIKNIASIKEGIKCLIEKKYARVSPLIRYFVITNDLCETARKHKYVDLKARFNAATYKVEDKYDIIINYNDLLFECGYVVTSRLFNYLTHEFQHVINYELYEECIKEYQREKSLNEVGVAYSKAFFYEFNCSYNAQRDYPIAWGQCVPVEWDKKFQSIKKEACLIKKKDKQIIEKLNNKIFLFCKDIMYDIAIEAGANLADNEKKGTKQVDFKIEGIDSSIEMVINDFIEGINSFINDDEKLLKYTIDEGLCLFYCICNIINEILKDRIK